MILRYLLLFLSAWYSLAHEVPQFPGSQGQKLEVHHQGHQQQQQHVVAGQQQPEQEYRPYDPEHVQAEQGHVRQHLEDQINVQETMTPEQLQFHYFKMHDYDNDNRLDGQELIKAITHVHAEQPKPGPDGSTPPPPPKFEEKDLEQMIDSILRDDDYNGDGYIEYTEFLRAQTRNARAAQGA